MALQLTAHDLIFPFKKVKGRTYTGNHRGIPFKGTISEADYTPDNKLFFCDLYTGMGFKFSLNKTVWAFEDGKLYIDVMFEARFVVFKVFPD